MAYAVYHTTGFILDSYSIGDFDRKLICFTSEFGIIDILAIGIDRPLSKRKSLTSRFSYVEIDVVHGRFGYRLTSGSSIEILREPLSLPLYKLLVRLVHLLRELLPSFAASKETFVLFQEIVESLNKVIFSEDSYNALYYFYALHIFNLLGFSVLDTKIMSQDVRLFNYQDALTYKEMYTNVVKANGFSYML